MLTLVLTPVLSFLSSDPVDNPALANNNAATEQLTMAATYFSKRIFIKCVSVILYHKRNLYLRVMLQKNEPNENDKILASSEIVYYRGGGGTHTPRATQIIYAYSTSGTYDMSAWFSENAIWRNEMIGRDCLPSNLSSVLDDKWQ